MDADMSNRTKQRRSGGLTLQLFQRPLHPELFKIFASEQVSRRAYEADVWLTEGGHVILFSAGKTQLSGGHLDFRCNCRTAGWFRRSPAGARSTTRRRSGRT